MGRRKGAPDATTAGSPHAEQPELVVEVRGASAQGAILPTLTAARRGQRAPGELDRLEGACVR
jgi:hypothetical protein